MFISPIIIIILIIFILYFELYDIYLPIYKGTTIIRDRGEYPDIVEYIQLNDEIRNINMQNNDIVNDIDKLSNNIQFLSNTYINTSKVIEELHIQLDELKNALEESNNIPTTLIDGQVLLRNLIMVILVEKSISLYIYDKIKKDLILVALSLRIK